MPSPITRTETKYHALRGSQIHDPESEYDIDISDEVGPDNRSPNLLQEKISTIARYRNGFCFLLVLYITTVIFGLLAFRVYAKFHDHGEGMTSCDYAEPSPAPLYPYLAEIPTKTVTFHLDKRFLTAVPVRAAEGPWSEMIPLGRGFVNLTRGEAQYGPDMGTGLPDDEISTYGVAVYHQLHCLANFLLKKASIKAAMAAIASSMTDDPEYQHSLDLDHVGHCFDYIRQSIMCCGDMSLEANPFVNKEKHIAVDGWGVPHTCRDWDTMWEFTTKYRMSDRGGAL